jgi:two-component system phosphate regulon sensor histidine kinase PhoR
MPDTPLPRLLVALALPPVVVALAAWHGPSSLAAALLGAASLLPAGLLLLAGARRAHRERAEDAARHAAALAGREAALGQLRRAGGALVAQLPDPLLVLDAERAPVEVNATARAMFGDDIAFVLRRPDLRAAMDAALAGAPERPASVAFAMPDGRRILARVVALDPPLSDGGRLLLQLSDRTAEWNAERARADFIANASHELRTPLASLIGFIDTLRGPAADDPEAQQRFLAIMAEQGARMNRLIDDLLSLSRIEMSEHLPPETRIALPPVVERVLAGFEPRLATRGARIDLTVAPDLPPLPADADQITQVLLNLLDNALKYGREAGTIRVALRRAEPDEAWPPRPGLVISVADEGAGIPREHLPRLTERFYRVDAGRSRAIGGTGLGLAIVKHIVNRHRGQLRIDSEPGRGTTVSFWLPADPAENGAAAKP